MCLARDGIKTVTFKFESKLVTKELRAVGSIFGKTDNEYLLDSGLIIVKYRESGSTTVHRDR